MRYLLILLLSFSLYGQNNYYLSCANDAATIPAHAAINNIIDADGGAFSFLVNMGTGTDDFDRPLDKGEINFRITAVAGGKFGWFFQAITSGTNANITTASDFDLDTWYHVTISINNTTLTPKIYIDGVEVSGTVNAGTGTPNDDSGDALAFGARNNFNNLVTGGVDELIIWDVEPTAAQALAIYQNFTSPTNAGMAGNVLAQYRCEDGAGQTLTEENGGTSGYLGNAAGSDAFDPTWTAASIQPTGSPALGTGFKKFTKFNRFGGF